MKNISRVIGVIYGVFIYRLVKLAIESGNKELIFLSIATSLVGIIYAICVYKSKK